MYARVIRDVRARRPHFFVEAFRAKFVQQLGRCDLARVMSAVAATSGEVSMLHDWDAGSRPKSQRMHSFKPGTLRGNKMMKLHTYAKNTLGSGNIENAVACPAGEDHNEWLAMHVVDFYNEITLLYGIVSERDTEEKYPIMGAGKHKCVTHCHRMRSSPCLSPHLTIFLSHSSAASHRYLWADNTTPEPLKLSAPAYVRRLFEWIEGQLNDENIFPTSVDQPFPSNFKAR